MTPLEMRMAALNLAEEINKVLRERRTSPSITQDVNIKVHALSMVISSIIAHYSDQQDKLKPALMTVYKRLEIDLREAWDTKLAANQHSEEDTARMLRKIGIIKKK